MNSLVIIDGDYSHGGEFNDTLHTYSQKFSCKQIRIKDVSEYCAQNDIPSMNKNDPKNDPNAHKLDYSSSIGSTKSDSSTMKHHAHLQDHQNYPFTCFVIDDFNAQDKNFQKLEELQGKNSQKRVVVYGLPVIKRCNSLNTTLNKATDIERPLYCSLMSDSIVCFTGFRKENKAVVAHCIKLVHYMGGSVRKEYNKRITHLIVKSAMSTKYKTAYNIGRCFLLTEEWILDSWKHRNEINFNVNDPDYIKKFKLKALYSLNISFYGFPAEETQHMKDVTIENGGSLSDMRDPACTHIVVNDQDIKHLPANSVFCNTKASIVKTEWFWASIQICCRASECLYEFTRPKVDKSEQPNKRIKLSEENLLDDHVLSSSNNNNNVNTNTQTLNLLPATSTIEFDSPIVNHRLSSDHRNLSTNLSTSASLLDATTDDAMSVDSPFDAQKENFALLQNGNNYGNGNKKLSKRSQRIYELYETEKRFVNILHTIIFYFKQPIEAPDQAAGAILDQTELKEIFGNLPPIYETHCRIKEKLELTSQRILAHDESITVGDVYSENADSLLKTYPPFVNFYEKTKECILNCDKTNARFHAFLKIAQSKPECGRQTLVELLIRPVQRLPSTLLILDDILKETPKSHKDHELLTKAIGSLKEVMTHINEDKRKVESQLAMFVLINDIENCPATLLSSHRHLYNKIDAYEMSNELLKKGSQLTLFLFSDCLEICKPRLKLLNAAKSPNAKLRSPQKCYKHIALFSLNNITKICDILQNGEDTELFGILCRFPGEKDKFFSFKVISGQDIEKKDYIKQLAQGICNVKCITEIENVVCSIEAKQLQLDLNESGGSKKFDTMRRYASRINRRVSRAFSFSQDTPNKIKKTISSVFRSPFQGYSSQSLNEQKSSKLSSLASLQLTPTILEKRKYVTIQTKSSYKLLKTSKTTATIDNLALDSHVHALVEESINDCTQSTAKSSNKFSDNDTDADVYGTNSCIIGLNKPGDTSLTSLDSYTTSTVGL